MRSVVRTRALMFGWWAAFFVSAVAAALILAFFTIRQVEHRAVIGAVAPDDQDGTDLYPAVSLSQIAAGKWLRPRATITGTVQGAHAEADGDHHFQLNSVK